MEFDTSTSKLGSLRTEQVDSKFHMLDVMSVAELLSAMNESDAEVPRAVALQLPIIEKVIDGVVDRLMQGGRLIYIGAGTSGRLGVLDAAECGPTFSIDENQVQAVIAGGDAALRSPSEGVEDNPTAGMTDLEKLHLTNRDAVIGIAASGRTPYVLGAIAYAKKIGALTVGLTCNPNSEIAKVAELAIEIDSGPELLAGSTRLKSGTAQKMVLNMISTITMVRLGKTFGNLMVDRLSTWGDRGGRAIGTIEKATGSSRMAAEAALTESSHEVKVAILMLLLNIDAVTARERLRASQNRVREALN